MSASRIDVLTARAVPWSIVALGARAELAFLARHRQSPDGHAARVDDRRLGQR
ncbi:MAG: hypothetical protein QOJ82_3250, partial [Solirubrobacteraceae bacterium]|nr:hypothetical protein [Solirubrobacteraceae bacterium]